MVFCAGRGGYRAAVALFTVLEPLHLAEICAIYQVGHPVHTQAIAAGTINSNFSIRTESGRYFLRVNEGKTVDDVAWEAQLVEWLARHGLPTPAPLPAGNGAGYLCWRDKLLTLFPWYEGEHLSPAEVTAEHAARLGQTLGQLHRLGQLAPPSWRRRSQYDHQNLRERYSSFATSDDPALGAAVAWIREALEYLERNAARRVGSTETLVHGDLFRDNVLWRGKELVAVLDFEQASGGTAAYDLAVCLNDWCWSGAPRPDLAAAMLGGYRRERVLTEGDRAALPVEVCAAAMRFTVTRITDVYLARIANPDKDFRDFLARLGAWQSPLLGEFLEAV